MYHTNFNREHHESLSTDWITSLPLRRYSIDPFHLAVFRCFWWNRSRSQRPSKSLYHLLFLNMLFSPSDSFMVCLSCLLNILFSYCFYFFRTRRSCFISCFHWMANCFRRDPLQNLLGGFHNLLTENIQFCMKGHLQIVYIKQVEVAGRYNSESELLCNLVTVFSFTVYERCNWGKHTVKLL